jgi:hypothetical protein
MSALLSANGFPAIPQTDDDQVTMNAVVYDTSTLR